jgi:signal transduction histidine kinase
VVLHREPLILSKLVKDVLASLSETLRGHHVELSIEERDTPILGDRELLKMILTQYLDNAAKYSAPDTPIDVTVRESDKELVLAVKNQGPVIEMKDRERVFDRFYRDASVKEQIPGTGLGLSIVKKAAEAHRGHVWVISGEGEGTTFFLSMPKLPSGGAGAWNLG